MDSGNNSTELPVRVYGVSVGKKASTGISSIIREFPAAHSLGFLFAQRNIKAKYRQSIFGIFWALLPPVATALVWIILNKANVIEMENTGVPYPLFVITGTILWTVFSNSLMIPIQTVQNNKNILVKVNFPRESLLINAFYEIVFNIVLGIIVIAVFLIVFKGTIDVRSLLFIPGILVLLLLGMGIGMLLLPISLLYKDIQFGLPLLLQFFMYLTPVIYPLKPDEKLNVVFSANPVTPVLTNTRGWLLGIEPLFSTQTFIIVALVSVILVILGFLFQRLTMQILIERMGS